MSKELVISSNRHETKVAILEDDVLVEIFFQRANEYSLAGSIHKGRVTRVLPGMQSAFVDLGLERDTFLYVSDFADDHHEDLDKIGDEKPVTRPAREQAPYRAPAPARAPEPAAAETVEPISVAENVAVPTVPAATNEVAPFPGIETGTGTVAAVDVTGDAEEIAGAAAEIAGAVAPAPRFPIPNTPPPTILLRIPFPRLTGRLLSPRRQLQRSPRRTSLPVSPNISRRIPRSRQ